MLEVTWVKANTCVLVAEPASLSCGPSPCLSMPDLGIFRAC